MLRVVRIATAAILLAGCPGGDDDGDDDTDAAVPHGIVVSWTTAPTVPGAISADLSVSSVELELSSLRVVGDAGPGDTRTTASDVTLRWSQAGAAGAVMFPDAPAGLYSRVELGAGGDAETYRFDGQVVVGGETFDFRIEDETPLSISLPIDVEVSGGAPTQIRILFDVGAVLTAVPFDQIPPDSGELRIEAGDPEIAGVRASMANAFRVEP